MKTVDINRPIGVFDSGVGGISVLKELCRLLPHEDFLFYGDSFNAPYGIKTTEEVYQLSRNIVKKFVARDVKAIVIACNTATSAAISRLRAEFPAVIFVGLEPAVKPAVEHKQNSHVLVMATKLTLQERKFADLVKNYSDQAQISVLPASELVEFVERGELDSPQLNSYLKKILKPYLNQTDAIVLGCTHFPFVRSTIQKIVGENIYIVDGALGAAKRLDAELERTGAKCSPEQPGSVKFYNSNPDPREIKLSRKLFSL